MSSVVSVLPFINFRNYKQHGDEAKVCVWKAQSGFWKVFAVKKLTLAIDSPKPGLALRCILLVPVGGSVQYDSYWYKRWLLFSLVAYRNNFILWTSAFQAASELMRFWISSKFLGSFYTRNFPPRRSGCFWFCALPRDKRGGLKEGKPSGQATSPRLKITLLTE